MKKVVIKYAWMLLPSFLTVTLVWYNTVRGRLYVCTDPIPVSDWIPNHVHCAPEQYYVREGDYYRLILTLSVPACLLTKDWPMRNTGAGMHTPVFLIGLHRRESNSAVFFHA